MSLASLLKKDWLGQVATATVATTATHARQKPAPVATIATVAVANPTVLKTTGAAANDPAPATALGADPNSGGSEARGHYKSFVVDPAPATADPSPQKCGRPTQQMTSWSELDKAYQAHHVTCPTCIGAGKGYGLRCGTGAALWAAYDVAEPVHGKVSARVAQPAPATHTQSADIHPSLLTAATPDEVNVMVRGWRCLLAVAWALTMPTGWWTSC
jgi:hypothetical protein